LLCRIYDRQYVIAVTALPVVAGKDHPCAIWFGSGKQRLDLERNHENIRGRDINFNIIELPAPFLRYLKASRSLAEPTCETEVPGNGLTSSTM
jgi:hypothetical protein